MKQGPLSPVVLAAWLQRVRERLEREDAERELLHLGGLSIDEVEVLVRLERGWGLP